jgi:hypothetical protein
MDVVVHDLIGDQIEGIEILCLSQYLSQHLFERTGAEEGTPFQASGPYMIGGVFPLDSYRSGHDVLLGVTVLSLVHTNKEGDFIKIWGQSL